MGKHFHALFHFQLMGVCGAFLTGDAFNLFVFFEVLLIASYGLMTHGGGSVRLKAGVQYVAYNLLGSTLFLFALGNDLWRDGHAEHGRSGRASRGNPAEDTALLRVGAVLLLLVFLHQGCGFAAAFLAACQLCQCAFAGGGIIRDHDEGGRLFDPAD